MRIQRTLPATHLFQHEFARVDELADRAQLREAGFLGPRASRQEQSPSIADAVDDQQEEHRADRLERQSGSGELCGAKEGRTI